jgi:non-specific serine/threonine protein kinase
MVSGRLPFRGPSAADVTAAILSGGVEPLAARLRSAPPDLDRVLARALRKAREDRYPRAADLLADLRRLAREPGARVGPPAVVDSGQGERPATNLHQPLAEFVGREREIAELRRLLSEERLVTLTGPGGIGKTRLALEVGRRALGVSAQAVWVVELAALADPGLVPKAAADALAVREEPGRDLLPALSERLGGRRALLVLDNCEHLVAACAALADWLLRACPQLRLLTTSREPLRVPGEALWPVPPLGFPDPGDAVTTGSLADWEATRLFSERAALNRPNLAGTASAASVVELCRRLDGIPLAIELAAARTRVLSVDQILVRLRAGPDALGRGSRTTSPRQQTLRAAIDWSYGLLTPEEQLLVRRLSVFAGGWGLEAAEEVASCKLRVASPEGNPDSDLTTHNSQLAPDPATLLEAGDVLSVLAQLVDKSLVVVEDRGPRVRYRMLETLREYAAERLDAEERRALERRHAEVFLAVAEAAGAPSGATQVEGLARLEAEQENLRAALRWSIEAGEAETCLRLCVALLRFWTLRGHFGEGAAWMERGLATAAGVAPALRARALNAAGILARWRGDLQAAARLFESSRGCFEEAGDKAGVAKALGSLALVPYLQGDYPRARELWEQNLALERELGNARGAATALTCLGNVALALEGYERAGAYYEESLPLHRKTGDLANVARVLGNIAVVALHRGNYARATALHEEALSLNRDLGADAEVAYTLINYGDVARAQGDYAAARARYAESLAIHGRSGDRGGVAYALEGLAGLAALEGQAARALRLAGAASALREQTGMPLNPAERDELERALETARRSLGAPEVERALSEGRALPLRQAVDYALASEAAP